MSLFKRIKNLINSELNDNETQNNDYKNVLDETLDDYEINQALNNNKHKSDQKNKNEQEEYPKKEGKADDDLNDKDFNNEFDSYKVDDDKE